MKKKKYVLGVTGPAASGKDEACKTLKKAGFQIIDADAIGHRILRNDKRIMTNVKKAFAKNILSGKGISRKKLGELVFSNKAALKKLNSIMHPAMLSAIKKTISASKKPMIAVNAAVLREIGLLPYMDRVLLVLSDRNKRLKRLMKRPGMTRDKAEKIISSQASDAVYKKSADIVIQNNGTLSELRRKV